MSVTKSQEIVQGHGLGVKPQPGTPASSMDVGSCPGSSTSYPAFVPEKSSRGWAKYLGSCNHIGNPKEAPVSWLPPGPGMAVFAI